MSDPIEKLAEFGSTLGSAHSNTVAGGDMLTAADVRRRGDRLRRRRQALVAGGAALAVAAVAVPILALAGGTPKADKDLTTDDPTPTVAVALSEADLLTDADTQYGLGQPTPFRTDTTQQGDEQATVFRCQQVPLSEVGVQDSFSRFWTFNGQGTPLSETVTEFKDAAAARTAYDTFAQWIVGCKVYAAEAGSTRVNPASRTVDVPTGGDAVVYDISWIEPAESGIAADAMHYIGETGLVIKDNRVAVLGLFVSNKGSADYDHPDGGTPLERMIPKAAVRLEPGDDKPTQAPTPDASTTGAPTPALTRIPDGIPLGALLPAARNGIEIEEPNRPAAPPQNGLALCNVSLWPPTGTNDTAVVDEMTASAIWTQGAQTDGRDLVTVASATKAEAVMQAIRDALSTCSGEGSSVYTMHNADTGFDSVTFSWTYAQGTGSTVFQFTRVGNAILRVDSNGEWLLSNNGQQVADRTRVTKAIAPSLCVFDGTCGSDSGSAGGGQEGMPTDLMLSPDGYETLKLGMTLAEARATGLITTVKDAGACTTFELKGFAHRANQVDGYISDRYGVVAVFARPEMRTAEGIGPGVSYRELGLAYHDATKDANGYTVVNGATGISEYKFAYDGNNVGETSVQLPQQDCFG